MQESLEGSRWRTGDPIRYIRFNIWYLLSFSIFIVQFMITAITDAASFSGLVLSLVAQ